MTRGVWRREGPESSRSPARRKAALQDSSRESQYLLRNEG